MARIIVNADGTLGSPSPIQAKGTPVLLDERVSSIHLSTNMRGS